MWSTRFARTDSAHGAWSILRPLGTRSWTCSALANLTGGGLGCHVDDDQPRFVRRRRLHFLVFYGFGECSRPPSPLRSSRTLFHVEPPYSLLSVPVLLGTIGGVTTIAGCVGFLYLAFQPGARNAVSQSRRIGRAFNVMLIATTASGLLVLLLRSTAALPIVLLAHLALVAAFFLMLPYGKFVHSAYRYAALVRYHVERRLPEGPAVENVDSSLGRQDEPESQPVTVGD